MKKLAGMMLGLVTAACLATAPGALAEEEEKAPAKTLDDRVTEIEKSVGALADFGLSGMAYGSYLYNFNEPDSRTNSIRSLDQEHNSLSLDLFQLCSSSVSPRRALRVWPSRPS